MKSVWFVVLLAAAFIGGYICGNHFREATQKVEKRTDTVYFDRPAPIHIASRTVNVPKVLFAPNDTIVKTIVVSSGVDSISMEYKTKTYSDSTYTAQVSGLAYGKYEPTLDWIKTYTTTVTKSIEQPKNGRWGISLQAGYGLVLQKSPIMSPYIGIGISYQLIRF